MKLSTQIILAFALIFLLTLADSYTNFLLSKKVQQNSRFLSHSEAIIGNSNKTHKAIIEMQSAFRGYLLTDDSTFLHSYDRGLKTVPLMIAEQRKLTRNDAQAQIIDSIADLHAEWITYSKSLIESRKNKSKSPEIEKVYLSLFEGKLKKQVGKKINDEITQKFVRFDRNEYKVRNKHGAILNASISRTHTISLIFITLTVVVGISSTIFIVTIISKRIAMMVRLADDISRGKFTIVRDTRNDELTSLSNSLNLMSDKLSKNIKELENRNAELNKFAYVVSHDLKAPIRGIHNVIKWIEEDYAHEISPQLQKYLHIIPQRTLRMEALINGLLDYARISRKTVPEKVDVSALVNEIADSMVPRNFTLDIGELPVILAERIKLEQVFENLISNAVKYTPHENGHIAISAKETYNHFEFTVKDNGIGIDGEYHQKIFEIFQTLREKNEKESTGVGLAIVKKIIDEQHGTISVKSKLGEGAEFIFTWRKN